jgi:hypothetical protein
MRRKRRKEREKKRFIGAVQDLHLTHAPNKNNEKILMILKQDKHWRLYDALCATQSPRHIQHIGVCCSCAISLSLFWSLNLLELLN